MTEYTEHDELVRLRFKIEAVRAVINSPRVHGGPSAADPDGEIHRMVFVKDIEAALDGMDPVGGACVGCGAKDVKTTWRDRDGENWWLCVQCMVDRDAERAEHYDPPGPLRWAFDGGRGAMIDRHDRIVGYWNPPSTDA